MYAVGLGSVFCPSASVAVVPILLAPDAMLVHIDGPYCAC